MESVASSAVDLDPFSRIPEVVLTTHLLPAVMEDAVGLTSLMVVSSHFRKVAMGKLTRKDWVQKMFGSKSLRDHFRSGKTKMEAAVFNKLPEWKTVAVNYFDRVYSLVPDYSSFKFLKVGSTAPLFGTPKESELWTSQIGSWNQAINGGNVVRWETNEDVTRFLLDAVEGEIGTTPFQTRSLRIGFTSETDDDDYHYRHRHRGFNQSPSINTDLWLRALKKFGSHIRYAFFNKTLGEDEDAYEVVGELRPFLEQMRGLQQLVFRIEDGDGFDDDDDGVDNVDLLPDLPDLTHLVLHLGEMDGAFQPFIKYSDQITTLAVKSNDFWKLLQTRTPLKLFPKLERLRVLVPSRAGVNIRSLRGLTCSLREIEILLGKNISLKHCFKAFQSFAGTLAVAKVTESFGGKLDTKVPPTVDMPNFRVLSIELQGKCGSFDGFLGLPSSLGYIKIKVNRVGGRPRDDSGEIIKLWEERYDLYNSDVWSLMPSLNEVWLEEKGCGANFTGIYTRKEYMKRQEAH